MSFCFRYGRKLTPSKILEGIMTFIVGVVANFGRLHSSSSLNAR